MKTSYNLSFLTSPRDPRFDNWIGQPFVLSYLNSEPGTNYVMAYRPFGSSDSRIERERRFAERNDRRNARNANDTHFIDRVHTKENIHQTSSFLVSFRPTYEAVVRHNFLSRLEESTAIVEGIHLFDLISIPSVIEQDPLKVERYIDERHIRPIISRLRIHGSRIEAIQDTILHLYKEYHRIIEHEKTYINTLQLLERANIEKDVIEIGKLIISKMNTFDYGIKTYQKIAQRPFEHMSEFMNGPLIMDKVLKDTDLVSYINAVRPIQIGTEIGLTAIGYREDKFDTTLATYTLSKIETKIGIESPNVLIGESEISTGSIYDPIRSLNKHLITQSVIGKMQLLYLSQAKEITILNSLISVYGSPEKNSLINDDYIGFTKTNYGPKEVFIETFNMFDRHIQDKEVRLVDYVFLDRDTKSKEVQIINPALIDRGDEKRVDFTNEITFATWLPASSYVQQVMVNIELSEDEAYDYRDALIGEYFKKEAKSSMDYNVIQLVDQVDKRGLFEWYDVISDERINYDGIIHSVYTDVEKLSSDVLTTERDQKLSDFLSIDARITSDSSVLSDAMAYDSWIVDLQKFQMSEGFKEYHSRIDVMDARVTSLPFDGHNLKVYDRKVDKIEQAAWVQYVLKTLSPVEKAMIIRDNWELFKKVVDEGIDMEQEVHQKIGTIMEKEAKAGRVFNNVDLARKEMKPILIIESLMADTAKLSGYLKDLMGIGSRHEDFDAIVEKALNAHTEDRKGMTLESPSYAAEPINHAIINELINAHEANNNTREAYIPQQQYVLSGDGSDWEEIWNRYSPGVDILDPPDSDYDYEQLASKVYNPNTGVPYKPMSPTNVADVKIKTPLHHPLPQHFDIGVDDTKQIIVDNYTFIDVTLAIESLKNRNKLRYAGMPAEKTVRELFSHLFTWINQAAPGNEEYRRMFRFSRWYAESAVLSLSQHILHRVYNSWKSTFHTGNDLGIPYTQTGWHYYPTAYVTQTISTYATYKFDVENYIDGEFILRGYFDNPLSQGTMELRIDGDLIDTVAVNGAFTRTFPVKQGKHNYEFVFRGESGRVSLSTIEISGSVFVSAHTTSDDSDTNGLKTVSTLINMLLTYFEKHHGSGKTKGTMAVKQRKLWQTQ